MEKAQLNETYGLSSQDIKNYVKMKLYTDLTLVKEKLTLYKQKYACDFKHFEKKIKSAEEENFEHWDDYMEWKAFSLKQEKLLEKIAVI